MPHPTYSQLVPFEKCVIDTHVHHALGSGYASATKREAASRVQEEAILRQLTLALIGIEPLIQTIHTPTHPEYWVWDTCNIMHPPRPGKLSEPRGR